MKKFLFILLGIGFFCISFNIKRAESLKVGDKAPDFSITDLNGDTVSLSDFKGEYILLDFWASWCVPCRKENPNLLAIFNDFSDKGFKVVGISLDKNHRKWKSAIETDSLQDFVHLSELVSWSKCEITADYNVQYIPYNFLINPKGKIVGKNLKGKELRMYLNKYLNQL